MKRSHLTCTLLLLLFSFNAVAQTQFWSDNFEDTGAPTSGTRTPSVQNFYPTSPPYTKYFARVLPSNLNLQNGTYSGYEGSKIWAGEDIDGALTGVNFGQDAAQTITWTSINITGKTNLSFKGLFACDNLGSIWERDTADPLNPPDYMIVSYRIDGGAWTDIVRLFATTGGQLALETTGDGVGDGTPLTSYLFTELGGNITGTGTTLELRFSCHSNGSGTEELAIDNFRLFETASCTSPVITGNPANRSICPNGNTTFTASATNATAYQWQVNTGSGFNNISNGGVYSNATTGTLTITGATTAMNGYQYRCTAINAAPTCFTNTNNATLNISNITSTTTKNDVLCFGAATGSATVAPTGGIGSYTYLWGPSGGTAATATGLTAGTYTVTITDAINCQITKTFTITQPAAALSLAYGGSNTIAKDASFSYTFTASGGTPGYTYSTTGTRPNGLSLSNGGVLSGTPTTAGTFSFNVIATDANSCTRNIPVSITVIDLLPVTLTNFRAKPVSGGVEISWSTISETSSSHFELLHATDQEQFRIVNRQEALGNSSVGKHYSFLHKQPTSGNNYYQLLQLDKNGDSRDYGIKTVYFTSVTKDGVTLYPNPATHTVTITFAAKTYTQLQVTDMLGKVVESQKIGDIATEQKIDVAALPSGPYTITLTTDGKRSAHKLIKL